MRLGSDLMFEQDLVDMTPILPGNIIYRGHKMSYDSFCGVIMGFFEFLKETLKVIRPKTAKIIRHMQEWQNNKRIPIIYNNFFVAKFEFFSASRSGKYC